MKKTLVDSLGRVLTDLCISVTDRCNFACRYCMPSEPAAPGTDHGRVEHLRREDILSFEEITRVAKICAGLGVNRIRLTGGEPLARKGVPSLVAMLSAATPAADISLTTNGYFLKDLAASLAESGLKRVNISLDSLKKEKFVKMARRSPDAHERVLAGIDAAMHAGLAPVKLNVVVIRGYNDDEPADFARFSRDNGIMVRFIEFMPLDGDAAWDQGFVVPGYEIIDAINREFPLEPAGDPSGTDHVQHYRFLDGAAGGIGIIAPVSEPFCGRCTRLRLTAGGFVRTCLFSRMEHDLRALLRGGASDGQIAQALAEWARSKEPSHNIGAPRFQRPSRPMVAIGG